MPEPARRLTGPAPWIISRMAEQVAGATTGTGRQRLLDAAIEYFAREGVGDSSLRQIAAAIGSSHRMLIYHFGSREGLLEAVVEELERAERDLLVQMLVNSERPRRELAWEFWTHMADVAEVYGPLYFELASRAMRGDDPHAPLRVPNVDLWVRALSVLWKPAKWSPSQTRIHSRLNLAVARGLLLDLLLTRDRKSVDETMAMFDWLCFREPSPVRSVARRSRTWQST